MTGSGGRELDLVIRGGTVVTGGIESVLDVGVAGERIVQLGGPMSGAEEIDATDRYVLPGGIDAHVHLTAPGSGCFKKTMRARSDTPTTASGACGGSGRSLPATRRPGDSPCG